jgi:myosin heavy subunit
MPGKVGWNMENDKQINDFNDSSWEQTKKVFLSDELLAKNETPEVYSLADEYAKSRKNKNLLVFGLSLLYISLIAVGVYLITTMEENKSKRIEVNIAEFQQFNLYELLAEQQANQEKLTQLEQELNDLRISSQNEIAKLSPKEQQKALAAMTEKTKTLEDTYKLQIQSKEDAIKELKKSMSENVRQRDEIYKQQITDKEKELKDLKKTVNETRQREDTYKQQIQEKEKELAALQKSLETEKQRVVTAQTQTNDASIEKYQLANQLQEVELMRLKNEYEDKIAKLEVSHQEEIERLKKDNQDEIGSVKKDNQEFIDNITLRYNPVYSQGEIAAVINSKLGNTGNTNLNKYVKILDDDNVWSEQDYNQLRNKIHGQKVIIDSLLAVGYTNSVPPALNRLDRLSKSIVGDYETLWGNLVQRIKKMYDSFASYDYAFNYLSTINRESGYVIDARDPNRMAVFINRVYSVKKGDTAYILKNDNLAIAKIELNPESGRITAKVTAVLTPAKIEPLDKILLKLEVNQ